MAALLKVPELGEGVDAVEVVKVLVVAGDRVVVDQPIVEVETEKASVEVPSEVSGVVTEVHVKVGDSLSAGDPIVAIEPAEGARDEPEDTAEPSDAVATPDGSQADETDALATGAGAEATEPARREPVAAEPATRADEPDPHPPDDDLLAPRWSVPEGPRPAVPAAPSVRRFAREVGVDINTVTGSGNGGRITIDDVKVHTSRLLGGATSGMPAGAAPQLPDFTVWGPVRREPMSKIRQATARNLARAWAAVPHVTHNDWADITALEELRTRYRGRVEAAGGKLTITAILVKVAAAALRVFPKLNASVDQAAGEIVYKDFVHVGVAVDTERGLLVPVIRNADAKNITEISVELDDLARRARERKLSPADMQGGTFSISNLGGIGGTGFSPIVNWPEVAILGVSRGLMEPRWSGESFEPRLILPLSLSYDHRLVDGADAARFVRWVAEALEQPLLLVLEG